MDDISSYEVAKIIAGKMLAILNGSRCATSGLHAVYPFALEALRELKSMGVPLGLVTNTGRELSVKALRKINAELFFTAIVGGDTCPRRKPDPIPLQRACEFLGVEASRVCMVGDSLNDVRAARRAGIPVWCVPHGYRESLSADDLGADRIVELHELPALLRARRLRTE